MEESRDEPGDMVQAEKGKKSMTKDYRIEIRVRNAVMLAAMEECGYATAAELARVATVHQSSVGKYLALSCAPIRESGEWRDDVQKIATALRREPVDLFPAQHLRAALAKSKATFDVSAKDMPALIESMTPVPLGPEALVEQREAAAILHRAIAGLKPRYAHVIRRRYGIDADAMTLNEIGSEMGLTTERVRQIELTSLRKIREKVSGKGLTNEK